MQDKLLTISKAAEYIGVSAQTLRRWHDNGTFRASFLGPGGRRLYTETDLERMTKGLVQIAKEWVTAQKAYLPLSEFYCQTSDVFKARLDRMVMEMNKLETLRELGPLVTSAVGEIGNNSYDHNLGNWPDIPGVFFAYDLGKRIVIVADRGRGVLKTLRQVRPSLANDVDALCVAFTEVVSGRAPENRGNGLKYVRKVVAQGAFELTFQSEHAILEISPKQPELKLQSAAEPIIGCLMILKF